MDPILRDMNLLAAAKGWHDAHVEELDHDHSSCWCCCITCDHTNPYFNDAQAAMLRQAKRETPKTEAASETALRNKIKAYADLLARGAAPDTDGPGVAAALRLILVGVYDPREGRC